MKWLVWAIFLFSLLSVGSALALDPVAPRSERAFGTLYVKTPNAGDVVTVTDMAGVEKEQKVSPGEDVKVKVGDYRISVDIADDYTYEQDVTIRPTERHEIIVPGYGNLRINGTKDKVSVYQVGTNDLVAEFNGGEVRTLPRGVYDIKIQVGKYTLEQNNISVVTNTLREIQVKN